MPIDELTQFLQDVADHGELFRIPDRVGLDCELAALTVRIVQQSGENSPVLLFESAEDRAIPVVTNLLGGMNRCLRLLGAARLEDAVDRIVAAFDPFSQARNWTDALTHSSRPGGSSRLAPRILKRGLCQQVVKVGRDVDLRTLPIPRFGSGESGPTITAGQLILHDDQRRVLVSNPVAEVADADALILHNLSDAELRLIDAFRQSNRQLPVALSLGGSPLLRPVAEFPLPVQVDPWLVAAILRNDNMNLVPAHSVELRVPAEAEIVIEGYVDPIPPSGAGVIVDGWGRLQPGNQLPTLRVTAVTHRANPILPVVIRSRGFHEGHVQMRLSEALLCRLLKLLQPTVRELRLPSLGAVQGIVYVSVEAATREHSRRLLHTLAGLPVLNESRIVVLVNADVDIRDDHAVWREVICHGVPQLDPSTGSVAARIEIDATQRSVESVPESPELRREIDVRMQELGLEQFASAVS